MVKRCRPRVLGNETNLAKDIITSLLILVEIYHDTIASQTENGLRFHNPVHSRYRLSMVSGTHYHLYAFEKCIDSFICRTYLARRRLAKAIAALPTDCPVKFVVHYMPFQLYPEASQEGEDKAQWYRTSKYGDSDQKMAMYAEIMSQYGATEGIKYKFGGTIANTIHAHRLIQHFQDSRGSATTERIIDSLYRQYFEEEQHPSSSSTLLRAAVDAGIDEAEAKQFIDDENQDLAGVKMRIREQKGNGIDTVPHIVFEGKRRDITLEGCREVPEYVRALQQVIKESG